MFFTEKRKISLEMVWQRVMLSGEGDLNQVRGDWLVNLRPILTKILNFSTGAVAETKKSGYRKL